MSEPVESRRRANPAAPRFRCLQSGLRCPKDAASPIAYFPFTSSQNLTCGAALAAAGASKKAAFPKPNIPASRLAGKLRIATL